MGSLSIWHWLIVLVVVLLIFGTKKLRNVGEDLGGAVKGFKEAMREGQETPPARIEQHPETPPPGAQTYEGAAKDKNQV